MGWPEYCFGGPYINTNHNLFILIMYHYMNFNWLGQRTKLSLALREWLQYPLEKSFHPDPTSYLSIRTVRDIDLLNQALLKSIDLIEINGLSAKQEKDLYEMICLLQKVNQEKLFNAINRKTIPLLSELFDRYYRLVNTDQEEYSRYNILMILKIFALYDNDISTPAFTRCITDNYQPNAPIWPVIFRLLSSGNRIFRKLLRAIPEFYADHIMGIAFLDCCNTLCLAGKWHAHPFNLLEGIQLLSKIIHNEKQSYEQQISAVRSLPFLHPDFANLLFKEILLTANEDLIVEAAWIMTKEGDKAGLNQLQLLSTSEKVGVKAIEYLEMLGKRKDRIAMSPDPKKKAVSALSQWLLHQKMFGRHPDSIQVIDSKRLYWPPTRDIRIFHLIEYTYHDESSPFKGYGLVGSIVHSFSPFIDTKHLQSPLDWFALHCNWEMDDPDFVNLDKGIERLAIHNNMKWWS